MRPETVDTRAFLENYSTATEKQINCYYSENSGFFLTALTLIRFSHSPYPNSIFCTADSSVTFALYTSKPYEIKFCKQNHGTYCKFEDHILQDIFSESPTSIKLPLGTGEGGGRGRGGSRKELDQRIP